MSTSVRQQVQITVMPLLTVLTQIQGSPVDVEMDSGIKILQVWAPGTKTLMGFLFPLHATVEFCLKYSAIIEKWYSVNPPSIFYVIGLPVI